MMEKSRDREGRMDTDELLNGIVGAAIEVHRHLGPGLLESTYQRCLLIELDRKGLTYETEVPVTVEYKGEVILDAYRVDVLVENTIVLELKAVENLTAKHKAQLLTYLKLLNKHLGLLINFNEILLKDGIRRVINGYH